MKIENPLWIHGNPPPKTTMTPEISNEARKLLKEMNGIITISKTFENDHLASIQHHLDSYAIAYHESKLKDICEMRLCESQCLTLKPNQLYHFTVDESCERCKTVEAEGKI